MSTKDTMLQAQRHIKAKQWHEAYELLITVDHPTADKWIQKLQPLLASQPRETKPPQIQHDYWIPLIISVLMIPTIWGILAIAFFAGRAERDLKNGYKPDGARAMLVARTIVGWLLIGLVVVLAGFIALLLLGV